jgi:hypothetical protein
MAGQIQLDAKYYPSDFSIVVETATIPSSGTLAAPLLYADRNIVIDSVTMYVTANAGALTNPVDTKIKYVSGATAPTWGTAGQDVGSFTQLAAAAVTAASLSLTFTKTNNVASNNLIPAGSWVWIQSNGVAGQTVPVIIQIRYRSQF